MKADPSGGSGATAAAAASHLQAHEPSCGRDGRWLKDEERTLRPPANGAARPPNRARYSRGDRPTRRASVRRSDSGVPNPAAAATPSTGSAVVSSSRRAVSHPHLLDVVAGVTPTSARKTREKCRALIAARRASAGTSSSAAGCSAISACRSRMGARAAACAASCALNCDCPPARRTKTTSARATAPAISPADPPPPWRAPDRFRR